MSFREFYCGSQMQKLPWKKFTAYLLHILSSSFELPRRGRLARQAKRCGSSCICFFSLGFRGEEIGKPRSKFWEIFHHFFKLLEITLRVLRKLWNVFKLCRETQKAWRHNRVYILSSKHTYRPMRARVLSQIFYNKRSKVSTVPQITW